MTSKVWFITEPRAASAASGRSIAEKDYESRLATWREWQRVSQLAPGE
jgi:hypothetical protein